MSEQIKWTAGAFKSFVIAVLKQEAIRQQKELTLSTSLLPDKQRAKIIPAFDAVAPTGFDYIDHAVFFDIKLNLKQENIKPSLKSHEDRFKSLKDTYPATAIIITNTALDLTQEQCNYVWDQRKITEWIQQYPIDFSNAMNLQTGKTSGDLNGKISDHDFAEKSENNTAALRRIIESKDSFSLVLGAGVSMDPGAKSWQALLDFFRQELVDRGLIEDMAGLTKKIGDSSLITAQLCKELYAGENDYFWAIHNGLYDNRQPINHSFSLYEIAALIAHCIHQPHFRVLTYNYDNYLEDYLAQRGISSNSLFDANCTLNSNVSIYHVHGFLPQVSVKSHLQTRHKKSIYLTEEDYNSLYNNPYCWQISSQLSFFRENVCLFVGCSLVDPNIRRLLEMTKKENRTHYAILSKDGLGIPDLMKVVTHFARLGIEIIWVDTHAEIAGQVKRLYQP